MKEILIYWLLGCVVIGPAIAGRMNDCPKETIKAETIVSIIAVWPAAIIASIGLKKPDTSCREDHPSPDQERQ